jgi:cysteine synthase
MQVVNYNLQPGNTPLERLEKLEKELNTSCKLFAKREELNPTGSMKDRAAFYLLKKFSFKNSEKADDLEVVVASSGNFAVSIAFFAERFGFRTVRAFVPETANGVKLDRAKNFGAIIEKVHGYSTDDARKAAQKYAAENPRRIFIDQHNDLDNPKAYFETLGPEIYRQTNGKITHLIHGIGTGGSLSGTSFYLKKYNPRINSIGVVPFREDTGIDGLRYIDTQRPKTLTKIFEKYSRNIDTIMRVTDTAALRTQVELSLMGYKVGMSSAASVYVAKQIAANVEDANIVLIFVDSC